MAENLKYDGFHVGDWTSAVGWCEEFVKGGLGYVRDTAKIGREPESRDFEGEPVEPLIHPTARIEDFVTVDSGTVRATEVGARSWLFAHVHLGHDVQIGEDCEISTGAVIGGFVTIDDDVRVGLNATILPRQFVGRGARIGAGAVVVKDVPPGAIARGNPARYFDADGRELR